MMTSSNGTIFLVTGSLRGHRWIQRPVTRSFDIFFDLRLNKRLSKQSFGWWFETQSLSLWRHCNDAMTQVKYTTLVGPHWLDILERRTFLNTCRQGWAHYKARDMVLHARNLQPQVKYQCIITPWNISNTYIHIVRGRMKEMGTPNNEGRWYVSCIAVKR